MAPNTEFSTQLNNVTPGGNGLAEGLLASNGGGALNSGVETQSIPNTLGQTSAGSFWQRLRLKTKVLGLALSLGVIPVIAVGGIGYRFVDQRVKIQATEARQQNTNDVSSFASEFMQARFQDLRTFSQLRMFADPEMRETMTAEERTEFMRQLVESSPIYDDIAIVDLTGKTYAVKTPDSIKADVSQNDWFLNVADTQDITWVQPRAPFAGRLDFALVGAAPIFDTETGEMVYMVRVRLDVQELKRRVSEFAAENTEVALIDANEAVFVSNTETDGAEGNVMLASLFESVNWFENREPANQVLNVSGEDPQLAAYAPIVDETGDPQLSWGVVTLVDTTEAFAASQQLLRTVLVGTGITVLLVAAIATLVATRATLPILQITDSVKRLGQGDFGVRINAQGEDEIAQLGANINVMAGQIQTLLTKQEEAVQQQITAQAQVERAEEERQRSEVLQRELVQLLNEMEEASNGNLTVRTELTAGEIGILGDVFNAIIENLRTIVVQVKQATNQVNTSIDQSEGAIQQLADEALAQMDEITNTLNSVEQMSNSIQEVANNARQAAEVAQVASNAAQNSGTAMDRTVDSILDLRSTVAETGKKVKQLGEASQQISQVVSLINEIAMKTNLLAVNASIEAAHAGEEGQGFAVVASEVGQLAEQSAAATKEIEQIVKNIQMGTRDVVEAMERGTTQVVEGTQLVQETKQGLGQIVEVSQQIDLLLQSISKATVSQAETSQTVTQLMQQITQASKRTSDSSRQVAGTLQNTVEVARQLESAVDQFKVQAEA